MKLIQKLIGFLEKKIEKWYVVGALFLILEIMNCSFLSVVAPEWVCAIVRIILILVMTFYVGVAYKYFKRKIINLLYNENSKVLDRVNKLEYKVCELTEQETSILKESIATVNKSIECKSSESVEKLGFCIQKATNILTDNVSGTKEALLIAVGDGAVKIIDFTKQQYLESADRNRKNFSNIEKQFCEQKMVTEENAKKQEQQVSAAVTCIRNTLHETDGLVKSLVEQMDCKLVQIIEDANVNHEMLNNKICANKDEILKEFEKKCFRDEEINAQNIERMETSDQTLKTVLEISQNIILTNLRNALEETKQNHVAQSALLEKIESALQQACDELKETISDVSKEEKELCTEFGNKTIILGERLETKIEDLSLRNSNAFGNLAVCIADAKDCLSFELAENQQKNGGNIQQLTELVSSNTECIRAENRSHAEEIVNEIKISTLHNKENYQSVIHNMDKVQEALLLESENLEKQLNEMVVEVEEFVNDAKIKIEEQNAQLHENSEKNLCDKIYQVISNEEKITDAINVEKEAIKQISNSITEAKDIVKEENLKLRNELEQKNEGISEQISQAIERAEKVSLKTAELQSFVTKLINQVIDCIESTDEKVDTSYNRVFEQVCGFSKTMKGSLDKICMQLDVQKEILNEEQKRNALTAGEQCEQTAAIKNEILEKARLNQMNQLELRARLESLQNQIQTMESLAEVLRNISKVSKNHTDPNRIEEIVDQDNGVVIQNHFQNDNLVLSEMFTNKKKNYDAEYGASGEITRTRNYDSDGSVVTELRFYPNGQVRTRIEKIKVNGERKTVVTEFDERGYKK